MCELPVSVFGVLQSLATSGFCLVCIVENFGKLIWFLFQTTFPDPSERHSETSPSFKQAPQEQCLPKTGILSFSKVWNRNCLLQTIQLSGSSGIPYAQKATWALASQLDSSPATCQRCCLKLLASLCSFVLSLKQNFNSRGLRAAAMLYMKPLIEFLAWNKLSMVIIMIIVMILQILGLPLPHSAPTVLRVHLRNASNGLGKFSFYFLSIMVAKTVTSHFIWWGQYSRVLTPEWASWNSF